MGNIVYDHLQKSTEVKSYAIGTQHKISKPIWIYIGQCKTKWGAYKLANTLMYKIPNNADFEIHVEHQKDGSWKVWYRILPPSKPK